MGGTRFSTMYLTLKQIQAIYHELHEKLEARGESMHIEIEMNRRAPDTIGFLIDFLKLFYEAQQELEGDTYPTLVCLWCEKLKRQCQPSALDSPQQAGMRKWHKDWLARKVIIQDLHKITTFLWPKFNQPRMLRQECRTCSCPHSSASHGCKCTRCGNSRPRALRNQTHSSSKKGKFCGVGKCKASWLGRWRGHSLHWNGGHRKWKGCSWLVEDQPTIPKTCKN